MEGPLSAKNSGRHLLLRRSEPRVWPVGARTSAPRPSAIAQHARISSLTCAYAPPVSSPASAAASSPAVARAAPRLVRLNVIVGLAHLAQAVLILVLAKPASLPVNVRYMTGPPGRRPLRGARPALRPEDRPRGRSLPVARGRRPPNRRIATAAALVSRERLARGQPRALVGVLGQRLADGRSDRDARRGDRRRSR